VKKAGINAIPPYSKSSPGLPGRLPPVLVRGPSGRRGPAIVVVAPRPLLSLCRYSSRSRTRRAKIVGTGSREHDLAWWIGVGGLSDTCFSDAAGLKSTGGCRSGQVPAGTPLAAIRIEKPTVVGLAVIDGVAVTINLRPEDAEDAG